MYPLSITQYGFFYHPAYELVGGDIVLLRQLNLAFTIGLGSLLGYVICRSTSSDGQPSGIQMGWAALLLGFTTLLCASNWLVTPNYNHLTLQGILVSTIALIIIGRLPSPASLGTCMLLGIGGWMTFLGKPSSAALLAVAAFAYLLSIRKLSPITLLVTAATSALLVLLTALAIDGSITGFAARLEGSMTLAAAMDQRYGLTNLFRIDGLNLPSDEINLLWTGAAICGVTIVLATSRSRFAVALGIAIAVAGLTVALLSLVGFQWLMPTRWFNRYPIQILAFPLGMMIALLWLLTTRRLSRPIAGQLQLCVLLIVLPHVSAFGTNGNYWAYGARTGIFWVAAAVVLWRAVYRDWAAPQSLAPILLLPFSITLMILAVGMEYPYRQTQPLRQNDQLVEFGEKNTQLVLSRDFAEYIRQLRELADRGNLRPGDPLIDLTGHYPGAPLLLGASAIGQAWMIGGYPGSEGLARSALLRVPCATLASSWLLTEPEGPRAISQAVLGDYQMRFEAVGSLASPTGSRRKSYQQHLLRPVHSPDAVTETCERERQK